MAVLLNHLRNQKNKARKLTAKGFNADQLTQVGKVGPGH